jgi:hypothetical protein
VFVQCKHWKARSVGVKVGQRERTRSDQVRE